MASVEEYLRREVGVPPLPPNQNNHKLDDPSTIDRGGQSGTYKDTVITTSRGGKSGKINPDSSTTQRGGVDGNFDPEASTTKRPQPTKSEYGVPLVSTRGGTKGHYINPISERPSDQKETSNINISRGGDPGKKDPNSSTIKRGGTEGQYDSDLSKTSRGGESGKFDLESSTTTRGGDSGRRDSNSTTLKRSGNNGQYDPDSSKTSRGGELGKFDQDSSTTTRGGNNGQYDSDLSKTSRGGNLGRKDPNSSTLKRGGDAGNFDQGTSARLRGGEVGSHLKDLDNQRPSKEPSILVNPSSNRPEYISYDPKGISIQRSESEIIPGEEIVAKRPPHHAISQKVDTNVERQSKVTEESNELEAIRPKSANEASLNIDGKEGTLSQISDVIRKLQFLAGSGLETLGAPFGNQVNSQISKWAGETYKQVTNSSMNAEDLYSYFRRLLTPDTNLLARIPLDIGLRLLLQSLKGKNTSDRESKQKLYDDLSKNPKKFARNSLDTPLPTDAFPFRGTNTSNSSKEFSSDRLDRESWKSENRVLNSKGNYQDPNHKVGEPTDYRTQFYGYKIDNPEEIVNLTIEVADRLKQSLKPNTLNTTIFGKGDPQDFWGGNYSRWNGFEMADNFYWGVSVKRPKNNPKYGENSDSFPYRSLLPKFPGEFDNGWWPVTACSFSKGSLQSKSFNLPFFNLVIPSSGERPNSLKLSVLDNVKHAIRYYLEKYIKECFDIERNIVLPYKNIVWCIEAYRFDRNISVLYKKGLLCVLSSWNAAFDGATGHAEDELDLNFEIVGEYEIPENSSSSTS